MQPPIATGTETGFLNLFVGRRSCAANLWRSALEAAPTALGAGSVHSASAASELKQRRHAKARRQAQTRAAFQGLGRAVTCS